MHDFESHGQVKPLRLRREARTLIGWSEVFQIEWGDTIAGPFRRDDLSSMCGFILWQANLMDDGTSPEKAALFGRIRHATTMAWVAMLDGAERGEEDYRAAVRAWLKEAVALLGELEMLDWVPTGSGQHRMVRETQALW